jgi:hypothetical protein
MNYDLAMMALEGLARTKLSVRAEGNVVAIEGSAEAFKHLARLCLLLGGEGSVAGDAFELQPGTHVQAAGMELTLRRPSGS